MTLQSPAQRALRGYIEAIEAVENHIAELKVDVADLFDEAKSTGFDVKIMRKVLKLRKLSPDDRAQQEALLEEYLTATETFSTTPMGQYMEAAE